MKKKLLCLLLTALIGLSFLVVPAYGQASDWALGEILAARKLVLVPSSLENKLQNPLTRAEFCELVVIFANKLLPAPIDEKDFLHTDIPFYDTDSSNTSIKIAYRLGIVNGVGAHTFAPNQLITRQEMAVMLNRALQIVVQEYPIKNAAGFAGFLKTEEGGTTPEWALDGVKALIELEVLKGNGYSYALRDNITSEQAILLTYRLFNEMKETATFLFDEKEAGKIRKMKEDKAAYFTPERVTGSIYRTSPQYQGKYIGGELHETVIKNGLKAINYARYLAGLPDDVTAPASKNAEAQYGPLILAATNQFSHQPDNTIGISNDIFSKGYGITSTANLGWGYGESWDTLYRFNIGCIEDSDSDNISRLGHRRWLLNPNLKEVGMGMVKNYVAATVFDTSRQPGLTPDYISWPAAGVFPVNTEFFGPNTAWSFSISSGTNAAYAIPNQRNVTVVLTRIRDNQLWTFNQLGYKGKNYFNVNLDGYGYGPTIIFRPDVDAYRHGDEFLVEIKGLTNTSTGTTETITYRVKFFL